MAYPLIIYNAQEYDYSNFPPIAPLSGLDTAWFGSQGFIDLPDKFRGFKTALE